MVLVLSTIILLVPLLWFAYIGIYSRYMADDYCFAANLHKLGFVGHQVFTFQHWSGRFSSYFLGNVIAVLGPAASRIVPSLTILGLVGSSVYLFAGLLGLAGTPSAWWYAIELGVAATLLLLGGAPEIYQSLYWLGGSTSYVLPLIGLLTLLALLIRAPKSTAAPRSAVLSILGFVTAGFFVGGFNEMLSCGMVSGFAVLLVADRLLGERAGLRSISPRVVAALVGTLLALAVAVAAPGNAIRQAEYPSPPEPLYLLATSFKDAGHFVKATIQDETVLLAGILLMSVTLGAQVAATIRPGPSQRSLVTAMAGTATAAGVMLVGLMLPFEYATTSYPVARALVTAQFTLSFGVVCGGCIAGVWLAGLRLQRPAARPILNGVAACLIVAGAIASAGYSVWSSLSLRQDAQEFAEAWDRRDARIRDAVAKGARSIRVRSLSSMGTLEEIKHDPDDWVNMCVAAYYGLDEVYAK